MMLLDPFLQIMCVFWTSHRRTVCLESHRLGFGNDQWSLLKRRWKTLSSIGMMTRKHCWCIIIVICLRHLRPCDSLPMEKKNGDGRTPMAKGSVFTFQFSYEKWLKQECQLTQLHNVSSQHRTKLQVDSYLVHFSVGLCYCIHHRRCCRHLDHGIPLWCWIRTMTILTFFLAQIEFAALSESFSRYVSLSSRCALL